MFHRPHWEKYVEEKKLCDAHGYMGTKRKTSGPLMSLYIYIHVFACMHAHLRLERDTHRVIDIRKHA